MYSKASWVGGTTRVWRHKSLMSLHRNETSWPGTLSQGTDPRRQGPESQQWQWQACPWSLPTWAHSYPGSSVLAAQPPLVAGRGSPNSVALQPQGHSRVGR